MDYKKLKLALYKKCMDYVLERIETFNDAIQNSKNSGNEETKSSAGDKHETGRAMMQLEQEKNSMQLQEALELKNQLLKIDPNKVSDFVSLGSLIITNKGNFYISISGGKTIVDNETYYLISNQSPIANSLKGAKVGEKRNFNDQTYQIQGLY